MKIIFAALLFLAAVGRTGQVNAQSQETQQLLLNVEKLAQFRAILNNMYQGYKVISNGYNRIRDISQGNFKLHQVFLDGLLQVSPAVKKYKKIAEIIQAQVTVVKEYKQAYDQLRTDKHITAQEIDYLAKVYSNLLDKSVKDLDELAMVVTANKLRMSDDERLRAIDDIYTRMQSKLVFLRGFNDSVFRLSAQRQKEKNYNETTQSVYGIDH